MSQMGHDQLPSIVRAKGSPGTVENTKQDNSTISRVV